MTTYRIQAPEQKAWDKEHGVWNPLPPYTAETPIFGVPIKNGEGQTDDPMIAVEFHDMHYTVTPDPHADAQAIARERAQLTELAAAKAKIERVKIKAEAQRQVAGELTEEERRLLADAEAEEQKAEASLADFEPEAEQPGRRQKAGGTPALAGGARGRQ